MLVVQAGCRQHEERIASLEATCVVLGAERDEALSRCAQVVAERDEALEQVAALSARIVELTKQAFGRRSERGKKKPGDIIDVDARPAGASKDAEASGAGDAPPKKAKRGQQPGRPGHGRRRYDHLSSEERVHEPHPDLLACPRCGVAYVAFGEERCEELGWKVVVYRVVHIRPSYRRGCSCGGTKAIVTAPPPPKVIGKGRLSVGFLARLIVYKLLLGLPMARIAAALALEGAGFAPGSLDGSLKALAPLLAPLAAAIRSRNATSDHLHMDETSWKVFETVVGKANYRWWCWIFVGKDTTAFVIKPGRGADVVADHLGIDLDAEVPSLPGGAALLASSDFATCYQRLGRQVVGFINLWCWAHIRRYFLRAGEGHKELKAWADAWLELIAQLFRAHRAWGIAASGTPEEASAYEKVCEVVAAIDATRALQGAAPELSAPARKVLATLDNEWDGLVAFLDHPGVCLDNNVSERGLRRPVVVRKNCYGSGAIWSAELAADAWTILATAAQNHLNPLSYLEAYLQACAEGGGKAPEGPAMERFMPWAVAEPDQAAWADTS
ncbi:MAG: IS66 family transposase [Acidimicrobiales bacterium]